MCVYWLKVRQQGQLLRLSLVKQVVLDPQSVFGAVREKVAEAGLGIQAVSCFIFAFFFFPPSSLDSKHSHTLDTTLPEPAGDRPFLIPASHLSPLEY